MKPVHHIRQQYGVNYLDRVADACEFCYQSSKHGNRIVARIWRDGKGGDIAAIRGDGRTASFRYFEKLEWTDRRDWDQVRAMVDAMAQRVGFA